MTWLSRLKNISAHTKHEATETTKSVSVVFVAPILVNVAKNEGDRAAANDSAVATTTVQADLPTPDVKGLPTTPTDGAVATIGLPELLVAELDADSKATAMPDKSADLYAARLARFTDKGVTQIDAESLADRLVIRDRDTDDRALCLECRHLAGYGRASWRCGNWQAAGVAISQRDSQLPADLVLQLQRCAGLTRAVNPTTKVT